MRTTRGELNEIGRTVRYPYPCCGAVELFRPYIGSPRGTRYPTCHNNSPRSRIHHLSYFFDVEFRQDFDRFFHLLVRSPSLLSGKSSATGIPKAVF
jgi:hypothetical protein